METTQENRLSLLGNRLSPFFLQKLASETGLGRLFCSNRLSRFQELGFSMFTSQLVEAGVLYYSIFNVGSY